MPAGAELTVPVPVPAGTTARERCGRAHDGVTIFAVPAVPMQVPVPVQPPPLQPSNVEPVAGEAVSTTIVFGANVSMQSMPQLMPAGFDDTTPDPLPSSATRSELSTPKFAVTVTAVATVIVHAPVPLHAPLQPTNVAPEFAVAVSVTIVPEANVSVQSLPQVMPLGVEVTVPIELPPSTTVTGKPVLASIPGSAVRHTPAKQSRPGGHSPLGPHMIWPSSKFG